MASDVCVQLDIRGLASRGRSANEVASREAKFGVIFLLKKRKSRIAP
jgi:hypothetical protein